MSVFHPTYFTSIKQFALMLHADDLLLEIHDNFQKQTYRNRCYIYGANGKQLLSVPIQKISGKQLSKDLKIDYSSNWQAEHLKSLFSAYSSSPFFEFYIDDLQDIFAKKETFILDLNMHVFDKIIELIHETVSLKKTVTYLTTIEDDYRFLVNAKSKIFNLPKYRQVFDSKHGFISNLSILDLLFMEGPAASLYLKKVACNMVNL